MASRPNTPSPTAPAGLESSIREANQLNGADSTDITGLLQLLTLEQRINVLERTAPESPRQTPPITTPQHDDDSDGIRATPCDSDDNHLGKDLQGPPEFCERPEDTGPAKTTTQQHPESENDLVALPETAERPENKEKPEYFRRVYDPLLMVDLQFSDLSFPVKALIDTGATSCSVNLELAKKLGWQLLPGGPMSVYLPDGTALESNKMVSAQFTMGADKSRNFQIVAKVFPSTDDVVLGLPWLRQNRFKVNLRKRTLEQSDYSVRCSYSDTINIDDFTNPPKDVKSCPGPWGAIENKAKSQTTKPASDAILTVEIHFNNLSFPVQALIDTGCTGCILHPRIAANIGSKILPGIAHNASLANGTQLKAAGRVSGEFSIGANSNRKFQVVADILPIAGPWQCVLGLPWLRQNGLIINPMTRTLEGPDYTIRCSINKGRF